MSTPFAHTSERYDQVTESNQTNQDHSGHLFDDAYGDIAQAFNSSGAHKAQENFKGQARASADTALKDIGNAFDYNNQDGSFLDNISKVFDKNKNNESIIDEVTDHFDSKEKDGSFFDDVKDLFKNEGDNDNDNENEDQSVFDNISDIFKETMDKK